MPNPSQILVITLIFTAIYCQTIIPIVQPTSTLASTAAMKSVASTSTAATTEKISIKLERSPIYAYPGIITDFIVLPAVDRTQDEIENLFRYEFNDNKYLPPRMYISRGDRSDQIRVMFDYQNDIPFRPFTVKFRLEDQKNSALGAASISIVYDSISGGITNALDPGTSGEDFIR